MPLKIHSCLDIAGALRNRTFSGFRSDDGRLLSKVEAKAELEALLAQGVELIPLSSECDAFDPKTGCPGHPYDSKGGGVTDRELMIETMRRQGVLTEPLIQWLIGLHDRVTALENRGATERLERRFKDQR